MFLLSGMISIYYMPQV